MSNIVKSFYPVAYEKAIEELYKFMITVNQETVDTINAINADITQSNIHGNRTNSIIHLNELGDKYHDLVDAMEDAKYDCGEMVERSADELKASIVILRKSIKTVEHNINYAIAIQPKTYNMPNNMNHGSTINKPSSTVTVQLFNDQSYALRLAQLSKEGIEKVLDAYNGLMRMTIMQWNA